MASVKRRGSAWQATVRVNGRERTKTLRTRAEAETWAAEQTTAVARGTWIDPKVAKVTLGTFAKTWLAGRHDLAVRTAELYEHLLDRHILPTFGKTPLSRVTPSAVRSWHAGIALEHPTTAAKAYRLLSQVCRAAVTDRVLAENPCRVKGAAAEHAPERPIASIAEVGALTDAMPDHLRAAVLLAAWCQLRRGELLGLRRRDIDLLHGTLTVAQTRTVTMSGATLEKAPKTDAGARTVAIPANVLPVLTRHLERFTGPDPEALILVGEKGGPIRPQVLETAWQRARASIGRPELRLHDLRHSGLTWSAATGASIAELMRRAGHASPAAALRYQHATDDRDRALAAALAGLAGAATVVPISASSAAVGG